MKNTKKIATYMKENKTGYCTAKFATSNSYVKKQVEKVMKKYNIKSYNTGLYAYYKLKRGEEYKPHTHYDEGYDYSKLCRELNCKEITIVENENSIYKVDVYLDGKLKKCVKGKNSYRVQRYKPGSFKIINGRRYQEHVTFNLGIVVYLAYNRDEVIPEGCLIDHIDGDYRNNKLENLQILSRAENVMKSAYERKIDKNFNMLDKIEENKASLMKIKDMINNIK